jgi:DNA-binding transcriptional regulator YiaG
VKGAVEALGSEVKLAERLRTSPDVLRKWLAGELQPPSKIYLAALQIVQVSITQRIPKRR